jgi:hypothetical protein
MLIAVESMVDRGRVRDTRNPDENIGAGRAHRTAHWRNGVPAMPRHDPEKSGRGLPHSKTLARLLKRTVLRTEPPAVRLCSDMLAYARIFYADDQSASESRARSEGFTIRSLQMRTNCPAGPHLSRLVAISPHFPRRESSRSVRIIIPTGGAVGRHLSGFVGISRHFLRLAPPSAAWRTGRLPGQPPSPKATASRGGRRFKGGWFAFARRCSALLAFSSVPDYQFRRSAGLFIRRSLSEGGRPGAETFYQNVSTKPFSNSALRKMRRRTLRVPCGYITGIPVRLRCVICASSRGPRGHLLAILRGGATALANCGRFIPNLLCGKGWALASLVVRICSHFCGGAIWLGSVIPEETRGGGCAGSRPFRRGAQSTKLS